MRKKGFKQLVILALLVTLVFQGCGIGAKMQSETIEFSSIEYFDKAPDFSDDYMFFMLTSIKLNENTYFDGHGYTKAT